MPATASAASAASASRRFRSAAAAMTLAALLVPPSNPVQAAPTGRKRGVAAGAEVRDGRRKRSAGKGNGNGNGSGNGSGNGGGGGGGSRGGLTAVARVNGTGHEEATDGSADVAITDQVIHTAKATSTSAVVATNEGGQEEEEEEGERGEEGEEGDAGAEGKDGDAAAVETQQLKTTAEHSETASSTRGETQQQRRQIVHKRQDDQNGSVAREGEVDEAAARRSVSGGGGGLETDAARDGGTLDGAGASTGARGGDNSIMIRSGGAGEGVGGDAQAATAQAGPLSELHATDEGGVGEPEVEVEMGVEAGAGAGEQQEQQGQGGEECRATGPCVWCERDELLLEYCKETGRREEVRCNALAGGQSTGAVDAAGAVGMLPSSVRYRSCASAEEDDFLGLFHFWVTMVALGALACFFMRRRQQKGGSLYDRRAK
ncbi:unnamed protein product [Pylaiella littoralis]